MGDNEAIGYVRVSTVEQAESGLGMEAQEARIRAYCQLHDFHLVDVIRDEGLTGKTAHREGLQRCLTMLREREDGVRHLVVLDISRVARSVRTILDIVEESKRDEWAFHSVKERIDTDSAMGRFGVTILAAVAELEAGLISERTRAALQAKAARGEDFNRHRADRGLPVDTRVALETLLSGNYTTREVANHLNARNMPTAQGRPWTHQAISRLRRRREAAS